MSKQEYNDWYVYHLIQSEFFNHYHFYSRRTVALNKSGLNCTLISFVKRKKYLSNVDKYSEATLVQVVQTRNYIPNNLALSLFVVKELLKGRKLIFHVLRVNANSLLLLKSLPVINSRLKIIYEFEGDALSELDYTNEHSNINNHKSKFKAVKNKIKKGLVVYSDFVKMSTSNALILMSKEHVKMWENRIGKEFRSFIFPSLPEEERVYFCPISRDNIRKDLKIKNKKVLIYVGNIVCSWQRLDDMCRLVHELSYKVDDLLLILLVPDSNIKIAEKAVESFNINHLSIIKSVPADRIYKYMSASDIALYLRHDHAMNDIVTSGKLGEYLATGLPVISTGANASILNDYMQKEQCVIEINDKLEVTDEIVKLLSQVKVSNERRSEFNKSFYEFFKTKDMLNKDYPAFIRKIINNNRV